MKHSFETSSGQRRTIILTRGSDGDTLKWLLSPKRLARNIIYVNNRQTAISSSQWLNIFYIYTSNDICNTINNSFGPDFPKFYSRSQRVETRMKPNLERTLLDFLIHSIFNSKCKQQIHVKVIPKLTSHSLTIAVALSFHIPEVPSSNLGPETDYPDWDFSYFSSVPPGKFRHNRPTLNSAPSASCHILSTSLIILSFQIEHKHTHKFCIKFSCTLLITNTVMMRNYDVVSGNLTHLESVKVVIMHRNVSL
jgi:hypothetical protein